MKNNNSKIDIVNKKVAIIGLGLIGGSIAKALHERIGIKHIVAVNREMDSIKQAIEDGAISMGYTEINNVVYDCDIIFICTPVKLTIEFLDILKDNVKPDCIITDVGSTKAEIIEYVNSMDNAPLFIGGHPMAGSEKTGYTSSFSHLFENAYYILSPSSTVKQPDIELMTELIRHIGAIPVLMDAYEHDHITGSISHIPHIIAAALVNLIKNTDSSDGKMQMLAAGGFKDITRIASSDPEMWESIVTSNKLQIKAIIDKYIDILEEFRHHMEYDCYGNIYSFFDSAKNFRDSFTSHSGSFRNIKGLIASVYEIIVDVVDKPGMIAEIAVILGNREINIKNINVSNSREFEQGCLRITLPDLESANIAFDLLCNRGYKVYKSN